MDDRCANCGHPILEDDLGVTVHADGKRGAPQMCPDRSGGTACRDPYVLGVRDALAYAAGFLDGSATGATLLGLPSMAGALADASNILRDIPPDAVRAAAEHRRPT